VPAAMQSTPGTDVSAFANAMDTPEGGTRNTRSGCTPGRVLSARQQGLMLGVCSSWSSSRFVSTVLLVVVPKTSSRRRQPI
jgi:hypothetical protein